MGVGAAYALTERQLGVAAAQHRVYTDRVCVLTDALDSDWTFSKVVLTAVATVETMPFAGHDEAGAATSSSHMSLGSGLDVNTPRPH